MLSKNAKVVLGLLGLGAVAGLAYVAVKSSTKSAQPGPAYAYGGIPKTKARTVPAGPDQRFTQPSIGYFENPTQ